MSYKIIEEAVVVGIRIENDAHRYQTATCKSISIMN